MGAVPADDEEGRCEGVDGLSEGVSCRVEPRGAFDGLCTISRRTEKRSQGGSSQLVAKRWVGSKGTSTPIRW